MYVYIFPVLLLILLYFLKVNNLNVATYNAHGVNDVTLSYYSDFIYRNIGFIVLICTYLKIKLTIYMLMAYLEWTTLKSSQGYPMVDVAFYGVILCFVKLLRYHVITSIQGIPSLASLIRNYKAVISISFI